MQTQYLAGPERRTGIVRADTDERALPTQIHVRFVLNKRVRARRRRQRGAAPAAMKELYEARLNCHIFYINFVEYNIRIRNYFIHTEILY